MDSRDTLSTLANYEDELKGILSRFSRDRDSIHIDHDDDPRFRQIVIELRDFLNDTFGAKNSYSSMIIQFFDEGISNFTRSPSFKSVENIISVVSSIITRINRNPEILTNVTNSNSSPVTKKNEKPYKSETMTQGSKPTMLHNLLKLAGYSAAILTIVSVGVTIGKYWGYKEAKQEEFKSFVEYLSIVKEKVNIVDVTSSNNTLNPGDKCELHIRINNESPYEHDLWVGASAINPDGSEIWNIREDKRVTIAASGITKLTRYLSFPLSAQLGKYDIQVNLWYGKISDPKQSELISSAALREQISVEKQSNENNTK